MTPCSLCLISLAFESMSNTSMANLQSLRLHGAGLCPLLKLLRWGFPKYRKRWGSWAAATNVNCLLHFRVGALLSLFAFGLTTLLRWSRPWYEHMCGSPYDKTISQWHLREGCHLCFIILYWSEAPHWQPYLCSSQGLDGTLHTFLALCIMISESKGNHEVVNTSSEKRQECLRLHFFRLSEPAAGQMYTAVSTLSCGRETLSLAIYFI